MKAGGVHERSPAQGAAQIVAGAKRNDGERRATLPVVGATVKGIEKGNDPIHSAVATAGNKSEIGIVEEIGVDFGPIGNLGRKADKKNAGFTFDPMDKIRGEPAATVRIEEKKERSGFRHRALLKYRLIGLFESLSRSDVETLRRLFKIAL
jgi:hypothetical protein